MYGGKVIDVSDPPASNFNSPLKLNVELTSDWDNYNISGTTACNGGARVIRLSVMTTKWSVIRSTASYVSIRKSISHPNSPDTRVNWKPEFAYGASVSLEVNNVLNNKMSRIPLSTPVTR